MIEDRTDVREKYITRAILVGLECSALPPEENSSRASVLELMALLETAGGECVMYTIQNRHAPDPRTFIGAGKVEELKTDVENWEAEMVIFDNPLSPSQQRVLSQLLGVTVLDRAGLILDIFAQRARTSEGRLQ
ncbi:MAG: GTPase HflX, partial [Lachnospiraceae bacterium]|nr:GTPase HflX [Lachnospiraceae bacterium]